MITHKNKSRDPLTHGDGHSTLKKISSGAILRLLRYPFVALSMLLIPRMMGDTEYGRYAYYLAIFMILDLFMDVGFIHIFSRFVPECLAHENKREAQRILHTTFFFGLGLTLSVLTVLFCIRASGFIPDFPAHWYVMLALQLLFTQTEGILYSFILSLNMIERYSLKEIYRSAFTFSFILLFYWLFGMTGALWGLVLNAFLLALIAMYWSRDYLFTKPAPFQFSFVKPYLLFGLRFYLPAFLFGLMLRSGNVFVQRCTGSPEQVAYYDVANQFLILISTFLGLIISTLMPSLTQLNTRNEMQRIQEWQNRALLFCTMIAIFSFLTLLWMGKFVITHAFGHEYAPVYANALVGTVAMVPILFMYVGVNYSLLEKKSRIYFQAVAGGMACMAAGAILLTPHLGALGTMTATLLGYLLVGAVFAIHYRTLFLPVVKPYLLMLIPAIALFATHHYLATTTLLASVIGWLLSSLVFTLWLCLFRIVQWDDLRHLIMAFKKKTD